MILVICFLPVKRNLLKPYIRKTKNNLQISAKKGGGEGKRKAKNRQLLIQRGQVFFFFVFLPSGLTEPQRCDASL